MSRLRIVASLGALDLAATVVLTSTLVLTATLVPSASLATGADAPPPEAPTSPPASSPGLLEKTSVEIFLLDVEARDRSGGPLRGLTAADFVVRRSGRVWPVVSVDDFCACEPGKPTTAAPDAAAAPGPGATGTQPAGGATAAADGAATADGTAAPAPERPLVVIYFDFGQMRSDGRDMAVKAARRWVTTVKAPDERVMIAGYVTSRGLLTLANPTSDATRLLAALDDAAENLDYSDPYALQLLLRMEECFFRDPTTCPTHAITEYDHSRRAFEALQLFLTLLAARPGTKTVLYFHENGVMETGAIYAQNDRRTNWERTEAAGAAATAAHATIYPLVVSFRPLFGELQEQILAIGSTLSESTGGAYNRGDLDLDRVVMAATRDCRCRYTLGFRPLESQVGRIASVSVTARGVVQRALYRVRPLSPEERFLRQASAILEDPASARDLPIAAAIRPVRAGGRRWDLAVEVAFGARALALLPRGSTQEGGFEVGAQLRRIDARGVWDLLATSQATVGGSVPDTILLHAHAFTSLAPGRYRLSAFVRDRTVGRLGGGEAVLDLPDPAKGGVAGPVMSIAGVSRRVSPLPLLGRGSEAREVVATADTGPVPSLSTLVPRGALLRFASWICGAPGGVAAEATAGITRDGVSILRLDDRTATPAEGGCVERIDEMATGGLAPGDYLYVLQARAPNLPADGLSAPFSIGP